MATYKFGIVVTPNHTDWLVQNASETSSSQQALALNGHGNVRVAKYYQPTLEKSLEVIIPEPEPGQEWDIPKVGQVVKYGDDYFYVASASKTETNTDFVRFSITITKFTATDDDSDSDTEHPTAADYNAQTDKFEI